MTTITVEIDKDNDLLALKQLMGKLGLKYQINENNDLLYGSDVKALLDKRYTDFKSGEINMVNQQESQHKIQQILASEK
ncbi:hypothetical protein [Mucilaginibacter sp.]|uniref:hypothetical protein n=1 Tax=Mucilaginibacter sp. TaxID=1882438 RepID=UPI003D10E5A5